MFSDVVLTKIFKAPAKVWLMAYKTQQADEAFRTQGIRMQQWPRMAQVLLAFSVLAASYVFGGWYWCLIYAAAALLQGRTFSYTFLLPLIWVALFFITGDRRLFFPFTMYLAVVFGQLWRGEFAAGVSMIIALFTVIRVEQEASFRVIGVELVVAVVAAIVGAAVGRRYGSLAGPCAAAGVALAGLLL